MADGPAAGRTTANGAATPVKAEHAGAAGKAAADVEAPPEKAEHDATYAIEVAAAVNRLQAEFGALHSKFSFVLTSQAFLFSTATLLAPRAREELHQFKPLLILVPLIGITVSLYVTLSVLPNMRAITYLASKYCPSHSPTARPLPPGVPYVYALEGEPQAAAAHGACGRFFAKRVLKVDVAVLQDARIFPMLALSGLFVIAWVVLLFSL